MDYNRARIAAIKSRLDNDGLSEPIVAPRLWKVGNSLHDRVQAGQMATQLL